MGAVSIYNCIQFLLMIIALLLGYFGSNYIKNCYLKRVNKVVDERIEDRNSWLFFPPVYNLSEKVSLLVIYIVCSILMVTSLLISKL